MAKWSVTDSGWLVFPLTMAQSELRVTSKASADSFSPTARRAFITMGPAHNHSAPSITVCGAKTSRPGARASRGSHISQCWCNNNVRKEKKEYGQIIQVPKRQLDSRVCYSGRRAGAGIRRHFPVRLHILHI